VLTCSAIAQTGIDALWSQVLKHRAQFERTGWYEQHRREQMVRWMWDLVRAYLHGLLHESPEIRAISDRVASSVRSGSMTAADGAESVLRAIGLGEKYACLAHEQL
jgi:GTPase